ncbi:short-chain fatty acid transporter [Roseomonas elaeocarpi]|uniref:Short-chain fatty acid transporter n=1 Tax=Roseomonas elaeocarpi TaxID=907779 RepID=A0ABV6JY54_9PROT
MSPDLPPDRAAPPTRAPASPVALRQGAMARLALRFTAWAETWFPDTFVFAAVGVVVVAVAALGNGATPAAITKAFGDGFWSLIVFSMQMVFVAISGYVVATSPPAARLIRRLAMIPRTGPGAIALIATISMSASFLNWGLSLVFSGLLARAMATRTELRMDYRAAGAAGYLGLGATWALGLSSSAAQLQANAASLPPALLRITGVLPFGQTILLWQSLVMAAVLLVVSVLIAWLSAPRGEAAVTAQHMGIDPQVPVGEVAPRERPGEWLEYSPFLTVVLVALTVGWMLQEFTRLGVVVAISGLNAYNLIFLMLGLVLHWRPRSFLNAVARAVPATTGVLIQFPLYGAIATIMTNARGWGDVSLADRIAHLFVSFNTTESFPVVMGIYSAVLGFFIPSGGGKWIIEAPYVMQAANELRVHLGWAVQVYNAAEALPNLVNPFWMLPLLGVLSIKARDIVGFSFLQLLVHTPLVLFMLWFLGRTLPYIPPVMP